jgi:twitching motility protein PilJ
MNVIQEITLQTSSGTTETASSIGTLAEMAVELRTSVEGFKLPEDDSAFDQLSSDEPAAYGRASDIAESDDAEGQQEYEFESSDDELAEDNVFETESFEVEELSDVEEFDAEELAGEGFEVEEEIQYEGDSDEFDDELDGFLDDELDLTDDEKKRD